MNEERQKELTQQFLNNDQMDIEACSGLEIQELIYLIHQAKRLGSSAHTDERIKGFYAELIQKIKAAETLFIAYDRNTNYPYIDAEDRIWLFSKEEYALTAQDYYMQQFIMLEMKRLEGDEITKKLGELHLLGLPVITVDIGQYYVDVRRDELMPPPDWSGIPDINIPVTNPNLQHDMIAFFQEMNARGSNNEQRKQLLQTLEDRLLGRIIQAKYLLPMQLIEQDPSTPDEQGRKTLKKGTRINYAILIGEEETTWLPVFTDWIEFEKAYDKEIWGSNVVTYEDILALTGNNTGFIINPHGISFRINANNRARIEQYRRELSISRSKPDTEAAVPKDIPVVPRKKKWFGLF